MSAADGTKAIVAALLANLGIAVTKFVAYLVSGSASMLAESIHSLADSGNQVLLIIGGRRSKRQATADHPFGYGRERYVYAFVVSIVLFSVGGLFSVYEGVHKVQHPEPIRDAWLPIAVLLIALALESWSLRTAVRESNSVRPHGQSWVGFVRHAKAPELPVVLLEDSAALVGLALALSGVSAAVITGNGFYDGLGSIMIGILLIIVALVLGIETKSLLLGEGAAPADVSAIEHALLQVAGVHRVIHMKTLYLGPDELLVAAKVGVSSTASGAEIAATIDQAERGVRAAVPAARVIYLEPDVDRRPVEL